jgi:hypothetical protein
VKLAALRSIIMSALKIFLIRGALSLRERIAAAYA